MRRNSAFLNGKLDRWRSKTTTKMVSRSRRRASHQTDSSIAPTLDVAQRGLLVDCPRSGRPKMSGPSLTSHTLLHCGPRLQLQQPPSATISHRAINDVQDSSAERDYCWDPAGVKIPDRSVIDEQWSTAFSQDDLMIKCCLFKNFSLKLKSLSGFNWIWSSI